MSFPKFVVRITKHKKPRHQIYQPGFNPDNSCWLEGDWLTLSEDEWESCKDEHELLYGHVWGELKKQHHRDTATPVEKMTKAQKQAWEHFSGQTTVHGRDESGAVICFFVPLCGGKMSQEQIEQLREKDVKIFDKVTTQTDDPESLGKQLDIPDDLLIPEAHDPWKDIVAQNKQNSFEMSAGIAESINSGMGALFGDMVGLMAGVAMTGLMEIEKEIIRGEWEPEQKYHDPDESKDRYVKLRATLKQQFGEQFDSIYAQTKDSHNSCARANLDNSKRYTFSFVLPEFHDDGTHEAWGENDVPLRHGEREEG